MSQINGISGGGYTPIGESMVDIWQYLTSFTYKPIQYTCQFTFLVVVTDGLPTQGATPPSLRKTVDGQARLKLFERAIGRLPSGVPINVILLPMEGDPMAPAAYWTLARRTQGAFLSPSSDWP
jgi:hypothetical protein